MGIGEVRGGIGIGGGLVGLGRELQRLIPMNTPSP